jgi:hypothetical protein
LLEFLSPGTKTHLDVAPVERRIIYYKGEGGGFPQVQAMVSLVCRSCPWFVLAPKVFQLCTYHFVLVLCRSLWVSEACHFFLVPSWSSSMPLYPSIVLRARERAPTPCPSVVFNLGLTFESLKELGVDVVAAKSFSWVVLISWSSSRKITKKTFMRRWSRGHQIVFSWSFCFHDLTIRWLPNGFLKLNWKMGFYLNINMVVAKLFDFAPS